MKRTEKKENAYLTVYLLLSLTVILSLCLLLIEGVRRNGAALEASCAADVGVQSIMAEYHRELLEQYNLFAIDCSYGTSSCVKRNTEGHLYRYLDKNLQAGGRDFFSLRVSGAEVTGVSILTDEGGAVFRSCAVEAVRDDVGLELLEQLREWMETVRINGLEETDLESEKANVDKEIEEYEGDAEDAGKVENPTGQLNELRRQGILKLVLKEEQSLSQKLLSGEGLIGSRLKQGRVSVGNLDCTEEKNAGLLLWERFLFQEYLLRYLGNYCEAKTGGALEYQLEYLLAGKETDVENLRSVAGRLCALREAANVIYLFSDEEKSGMAESVASLICTALQVPELTPVLKTSIILGWAYAESVHDVKRLLAGKRIPLLKDEESWYLGLENALSGDFEGEEKEDTGLSYEDYLRIFLMLSDLDSLTSRAMDMVEADIRLTPGNECFRLDGCYSRVETRMNVISERGYGFELIRTGSYQ